MKAAQFKCLKCRKMWFQKPGPAVCDCGHMYLEWVNFNDPEFKV